MKLGLLNKLDARSALARRQRLDVPLAVAEDGACARVCVLQVHRRVAQWVQHGIIAELVVAHAVAGKVEVLDARVRQHLSRGQQLLLGALGGACEQTGMGPVARLIQQVH